MIVQLERDKDELNKKMEEKEQLDLEEKRNFNGFSRCIVVFSLLGLLFCAPVPCPEEPADGAVRQEARRLRRQVAQQLPNIFYLRVQSRWTQFTLRHQQWELLGN